MALGVVALAAIGLVMGALEYSAATEIRAVLTAQVDRRHDFAAGTHTVARADGQACLLRGADWRALTENSRYDTSIAFDPEHPDTSHMGVTVESHDGKPTAG